MSAIVQKSLFVLLMLISVITRPLAAQGAENPVMVRQAAVDVPFANDRQIIRTSSGRLYYISGNAGHTSTWDGWIEVSTSTDGAGWTSAGSRDQWHSSSAIGVAVDSRNIVHLLTYDWNNRPTYMTFNSADSPKGDHSWEPNEALELTKSAVNGRSAVAVDANDNPHLVYQLQETYKGKSYTTLTYASRIGGVWNRTVIWPKEGKISFAGKVDIAIGPDNIPYILAGNKILKGNANGATVFETKDLGTPCYSLVTHANGDVRVALSQGGNYANYLHSQAEPWSSGWTLSTSSTPDSGGILLLANDRPYLARLLPDGIWLQKDFDPPMLAVPQPSGITWQSLTTRWSRYHQARPGVIDLGTRSWSSQGGNQYWYVGFITPTEADFSASPLQGVAPLLVSFSDRSSPEEGRTISAWEWDFNKDGAADATTNSPAYRFDTAGKYQVQLKVTDSLGGIATKSKPDFIEVFADSDSDGVPDPLDNCPNDYNPLQLDLNGNGIGDTCEPPINGVQHANFMTKLRSMTAADRNMQDVTAIMTDGLLQQSITLSSASNNMVSIQLNKDARTIKKLVLRLYIDGLDYNPFKASVYVMPYNSDLKTTVDVGMTGGWTGWNDIDLTPILHRMDGYGVVKFRIAALNQSSFNVQELSLREFVDEREISATPPSMDFGVLEVTKSSTATARISNSGSEALNILRVRPPSSPFAVSQDQCSGKILGPSGFCEISLLFAPTYHGSFSQVFRIDSTDADRSSLSVNLQGSGALVLGGTVRDAATGYPMSNVTVSVTDAVRTATAVTDAGGNYGISGMSPGDYTASFTRSDYQAQTLTGTIRQGETNRLDVALSYNYGSLSGNVTDQASGLPLAGVAVTLNLTGIRSKDPADAVHSCNDGVLSQSDYIAILNNDGAKFVCDGFYVNWDYTSPIMRLKVRNSFGADSFTARWNGVGATRGDAEYLAQSFRPTKNGKLSKVNFHIPSEDSVGGNVFVLLKSKLGGDRGDYIAKSNVVYIQEAHVGAPVWVDFIFAEPPEIISGQEYFLEINGTFFQWSGTSGYLRPLGFSGANDYSYGNMYERRNGVWIKSGSSLAFRTYLDGNQDITAVPSTVISQMYGGNDVCVTSCVFNYSTGKEVCVGTPNYEIGSDGYHGCNGDDVTHQIAISEGASQYYEPDGWLRFKVYSYSTWSSSLATDQFSLTFNRTFTAVTDSSGTFRFTNLPEGNYILTVGDASYKKQTFTGTIAIGDNIVKNVAVEREPAPTLQGRAVSISDRNSLAGVTVTVADNGGQHATTTDANGVFLIGGLAAGPFTATLAKSGYESTAITGVLTNYATTDAGTIYLFPLTGAPPILTVAPTGEIAFGRVRKGESSSRSVVIGNTGSGDLIIRSIAKPAAPFMISADGCTGKIVPSGDSCHVELRFLPEASGQQSGAITIGSNDPTRPILTITLSGRGNNGYLLPDTGQSACYDSTGRQTPCSNTFGQDGNDTINPLSYSPVSPGVVKDNNTGLHWQKNIPATVYTWQGATDYCASLVLDGLNGWRLPTYLELLTLVNYSVREPAINSLVFPTDPYAMFWSSSSGENIWGQKKYLNIELGDSYYKATDNELNVRCVRGSALQEGVIVDNRDGTVTDTETGLTWTKELVSTGSTWSEALALPNGLTYADYSDWRLPNAKELSSYLQYPYYDEYGVWTSTTQLWEYPAGSYRYALVSGNDLVYGSRKDNLNSVRLVRGGNRQPLDSQSITVSPLAHDFGTVAIGASGSRVITIGNNGGAPLTIGQIPGPATPFGLNSDTCSGRTLAPEGSCTFSAYFAPATGGSFAAVITIPSGDADRPAVEMALTGTALPSGAAIGGSIFDHSTGLPVAGATVVVTDGANSSHEATTDGSGRFYLANPATGLFTVTIAKTGYVQLSWSGALNMGQLYDTSRTLFPILPEIGTVAATTPAADRAVITWTTGTAATGRVEYGLTSAYGSVTTQTASGISHDVTLTGLLPATTYHYRITATNGYGNSATTADATFTTPLFTARQIADSGNIAIMETTGSFDGTGSNEARRTATAEYFRTHQDSDFLVYLATFDYALPEAGAKGYYSPVKNDVQGINQPIIDNSSSYGSSGRLQGTIDMGNITALAANPYGTKLDDTVSTLNHELMHRWGAYSRFRNPDGTVSSDLLGKDNAHWSYLLDSKGSLMYGSGWMDNRDGTFTATSTMSGSSPLDLYLMGMIPKEQVPPMTLIVNPAIDKNQIPHPGDTVIGTTKTITIDDIIAAEGERVPNAAAAQKEFKVGFVLLIRPGENPAGAAAAVETLRSAWAGRFAELTRGKGSISGVAPSLVVNVDSPADNATVTGPDVTVAGTVINSTGAETGVTVNGIPATVTGSRFIVNHVPLQEGSNTITVTATDANGLTVTAARNVTAQAGHYLRITPNIDSGTGPLDVSLRISGSFSSVSYVRSATGPVPVSIIPGQSPEEFSTKLSAEGSYTITASATGPDGQIYSDSLTITVLSKEYMDMLLQNRWNGMKSAMALNDVSGALSFVSEPARNKYQPVFQALSAHLPDIAANMGPIVHDYIRNDVSEYRISRTEIITAQPREVTYFIYFSRDKSGLWKIDQM